MTEKLTHRILEHWTVLETLEQGVERVVGHLSAPQLLQTFPALPAAGLFEQERT